MMSTNLTPYAVRCTVWGEREAKVTVMVSHEPHLISLSLSLSPRMIRSNKVITLINSCAWWTVIR